MWWNVDKQYSMTVNDFMLVLPEPFYQLYLNSSVPDMNGISSLQQWLGLQQDTYAADYTNPEYFSADYLARLLTLHGEIWVNTIKTVSGKPVYVPVIMLQLLYNPAGNKVIILNPVSGVKETLAVTVFVKDVATFQAQHPYKAYAWSKKQNAAPPLRDTLYAQWWDSFKPADATKLVAGGTEVPATMNCVNWKNNQVPYFGSNAKIFGKTRSLSELNLKTQNAFFRKHKTLQRPSSMVHDLLLHETTSWSFLTLPGNAAGPFYPHFCVQPDGNAVQYFDMHEYHHHVEGFAATSVGIDCSGNPWTYHADNNFKSTPMYYAKKGTVAALQKLIGSGYNFANTPAFDYIFAPPAAQLEAMAMLMKRLMVLQNIPLRESSWAACMTITGVVELARLSGQYGGLTDSAIALKITGVAGSLQKKVMLIRRVPEYFLFDITTPGLRRSVKPCIYSHGMLPLSANSGNHSDGHIQGVYSWLRLAKNLSPENAYSKMQELFNTKRFDLTIKGFDINVYALDVTTI
jgi:hypothetical protein